MPVLVGPVDAGFQTTATDVLRDMAETAVPEVRRLMLATKWELHDAPSKKQLDMLAIPPTSTQVLLGLFTAPPPTIALFGRNIAFVAAREGVTLRAKTREVAIHELAQHRVGLNHVHEEAPLAAANLQAAAAAFAQPDSP